MWVRGLKLLVISVLTSHQVAPYVGAWIETQRPQGTSLKREVAPYVGAWIETMSRLYSLASFSVAPYVGAWIETEQTK